MRVWLPASVSPEKKEEDEKTNEDKREEKKRREKVQMKKRSRGGSAAIIAGVSHKVRKGLGGTTTKCAIKNHSSGAIPRAMK